MPAEIRIEHRYPDALPFLRRHGADALAILHALLVNAEVRDGRILSQTSTRQLAQQLEFASKDTVHRRLRQLNRARVIHVLDARTRAFDVPTYVIDLTGTGIALSTTA